LALLGVGSALLLSSEASAQEQPWLRDRRLTDGRGIRTDTLEIHAGVAAGLTYDTNVFLRADSAAEPRADAFRLAITPFASVATRSNPELGRPSYAFTGNAAVSYYEFFKGQQDTPDDLSGHRNVGVLAALALTIAPGARWSGDLHGSVVRSIQPSNLGDPTASFNRTVPSAGVGLIWAPGGGLFSWKVGYDGTYNYFEASRFKEFNNLTHVISSTANWRFLPRTSLFSDSRLTLIRYVNPTIQSNGDAISTRIGANGLVTSGVGFLVAGGWASTVFGAKGGSGSQDFDSFVAQAELRFYLSAPPKKENEAGVYPSTFTVGYIRDWSQSYIGNFYQRDRGYASLGYFFNGVVLATLTGGVARIGFPATTFPDGTPRNGAFSNTAVDATAFVEYRVGAALGVNFTAAYTQMISNTFMRGDPNNPAVVDDLTWKRLELTLGLRYLL
jgi:hypothetical protein